MVRAGMEAAMARGGSLSAAGSKVMSAREALQPLRDGCTVMVGGFGLAGCPVVLIDALVEIGVKELTIISNNLGEPGRGPGKLLRTGQVRKVIGSYFTTNPEVVQAWKEGRLEVELWPQGSLAEAIRAGGAGIAAFYVPTAAGTELARGLEVREFNGRPHVLVPALRADVALIHAFRADELGNLVYRKTARNFNPIMATAADYVVAEVEELVPVGALDPEAIVTPHLFVDALVVVGPPRRGGGGGT